MKKITVVFLGLFAIINLQAQNYYIDFTASGATTTLDSVFVENLTQGTSLTMQGSDTLHLYGTAGVTSYNNNITELKTYPNPFTETSYLEFYNENQTMIAIDIYDVVGKNVLSLRQEMERGMHFFEMTGFATGNYQLIVRADTWQKSAGFVSLHTGNQNPQIQHRSSISNEMQPKSTSKSTKSIVSMSYNTGDQLRFTGYSGLLSEIVDDVPTSSKTINFAFTAFLCGDNVTFIYGGTSVTYGTVMSSGNCWLDRNLGATQVASHSTDFLAYGDLFQWGRAADGHQLINWTAWNAGTPDNGTTATLSLDDTPGHANFILAPSSPCDWRTPQNPNLWQGVSGVNNPCPPGWRIPTEAEWNAERLSWSSNNYAGAFGSPLKLPMAGLRYYSNGSLFDAGSVGFYWSCTVGGTSSRYLDFSSCSADMGSSYRTFGFSVRCLKDN